MTYDILHLSDAGHAKLAAALPVNNGYIEQDEDGFPVLSDEAPPAYVPKQRLYVPNPGPRKCDPQNRCQCGLCTDLYRDRLDEPEEAL